MEQLNDYIQQARKAKASDDEIRSRLIEVGWSRELVDQALNTSRHHLPPAPAPQSIDAASPASTQHKPHVSIGMWEGFEHVLMFLSLYTFATSFGLLVHQYINIWLPAAAGSGGFFGGDGTRASASIIRASIASLVVSFPLFAFFYLDIIKRTLQNPDIKHIRSRKFFIYLTLVGTFVIGVAKVVQTVFAFLDGNVTVNFIAHVVLTITIVALIFIRFLADVKADRGAA